LPDRHRNRETTGRFPACSTDGDRGCRILRIRDSCRNSSEHFWCWPRGYRFNDYVKAGTGLVVVCFIVSIIIIPMVWPFFPGK
jgi:hypothetical protein